MVLNTVCHFVDSNLGAETSQKTGVTRKKKRMCWNRGPRHHCILVLGFQGNFMQSLSTGFFMIKKNSFYKLYFLSSRDYWISSDLPSYGSNSRLLSIWLKEVFKDFPYTLRVPSTDCFNSIASHKKSIFLNIY